MIDQFLAAATAGSLALAGGGTGLLNVPSAELQPTDTLEYQHSRAFVPAGPGQVLHSAAANSRGAVLDHLQFSVIPRVEFGARLTTYYGHEPRRIRGSIQTQHTINDLSGHIKLQLVKRPNFRLAAGVRDVSGEGSSQKLTRADFVVADYLHDNWLFTLGLGRAQTPNATLDGPFGGVRYTPRPWLSLLADHDAVATQAGVQFQAQLGKVGLYSRFQYSDYEFQGFGWAVGMRTQLGQGRMLPELEATNWDALLRPVPELPGVLDALVRPWSVDEFAERRARGQLRGQVAGNCGRALQLHAAAVPLLGLNCQQDRVDWRPSWQAPADRLLWHLEARIHPVAIYAVGTEVGRLDISTALRNSLQFTMPFGFSAYGVWDAHLYSTDDYRDASSPLNGGRHIESGLKEYALQHTYHLWPGVFTQLTHGKATFRTRTTFQRAEVVANVFRGRAALNYSVTTFEEGIRNLPAGQRLWKVFAWLQPGKFALEFARGQFLFDQEGQRLDLYRYLGRTRVGLFYKNGLDNTGRDLKTVGLNFNISFDGKQAYGNRWVSIKTHPQFLAPLETQIDSDDGRNLLRPDFLGQFNPQRQLIRDVLDRWRVSPFYVEHRFAGSR